MEIEAKTENNDQILNLKEQIGRISDQLCLAVKGDFGFTVEIHTVEESIQKLTMLLNFVIDTARRALAEVQDKNTKLLEMDQVKSDFMANISHELRTPLTLILGPLDTILNDSKASIPSNHLNNLQRIQRNATRLYMLVNDLLDFSKLEAGKFTIHNELLDVNQLASQLVEDAQGLAVEKKLTLSFLPDDSLQVMLFDRKMLEKIILNLLSNALKFTPEGGSIKVIAVKQENNIVIAVEDTGLGIPESELSKLFERFHQVDSSSTRAHEGTGIGLALISQFAQLMGGNVTVESEEGTGTKFTVTLPIHLPSQETMSVESSQPKESEPQTDSVYLSKLAKKTEMEELNSEFTSKFKGKLPLIVVADDNDDMRSYIVSLLEGTYEIIAVENGQLALEAVQKYQPQVVLSDVMMPIMDGCELAKTMKADPKIQNIPIILITARAGKEEIVSGLSMGADDYLPKPFSPAELKARTAAALRLHHQNYTKIEEANRKLRLEIEERKILEAKNEKLNDELITAARRAGMADIATSVLHNIGNVLNSVNTSITMISRRVDETKVSNLSEIGKMINENKDSISQFLDKDPKGQLIPSYLIKLANAWVEDKQNICEEIKALTHNVQHIKEIIIKQNAISRSLGVSEEVSLTNIMEDALVLNRTAYERAEIEITREFSPLRPVIIDRVKLLQIIVNLIKNSVESILEKNLQEKKITLRLQEKDEDQFMIQVIDNGVGILKENLDKMFTHGFTTKKEGHGFGLHGSAIAVQEMDGKFYVESQGLGKGATFTMELPYKPLKKKEAKSA